MTEDSVKTLIILDEANSEGAAIEQFKETMKLEGMVSGVAHPDLHVGKGHPVGATFISKGHIYPYILGNDIGCGMTLYQTDMRQFKFRADKIAKKLKPRSMEICLHLGDDYPEVTSFRNSLGTIGGGNHFAEFHKIEKVVSQEEFEKHGLDKDKVFLLIHSGSRALGESILWEHTGKYKSDGLEISTEAAQEYLKKHDYALMFAKANRELIAKRIFNLIGIGSGYYFKILDLPHNFIEKKDDFYFHRKGASSNEKGLAVIPGSRGSFTYLVKPKGDLVRSLYSIAHGAGRKWKRGECKARLSGKFSMESMRKTKMGNLVLCEDKDLMYEEAPDAYKSIEKVIGTLLERKMIDLVAILRPTLTYKKKRVEW